MKNTSSVIVPVDESTTTTSTPHQIEDSVHKITAHFFGTELLSHLQIEGEIDHIGPTETVHLEIKKYYQDFNYVMKDGSWTHLEFQSTDKGIADLKRFRSYEAVTSQKFDVDVRTYVLYSGSIEKPITEFTSGFNTYRVKPIIMKGHRAEDVFDNITYKLENNIPLTKEDLVPLTLCSLMGGNIPQKERFQKSFQFVKAAKNTVPDTEIIEAVIYAMATKFLNETDMNAIKEEVKMTPLGTIIYNDGVEKTANKLARTLLLKGVSFDIIRESIDELSEETLQKIYDEVMENKKA